MAGPIDAGEGAGADQIQHLVVAVEEAGALAAQQALGLIVGQQLAAQQKLLKLLAGELAAADLAPDLLELALVEQVQVEGALSELFSRQLDHGKPFSRLFRPGKPPLSGKLSSNTAGWTAELRNRFTMPPSKGRFE